MKKNLFLLIIFISVLVFEIGCGENNGSVNHEQPIVKVFDKYLYTQDLEDLIPAGTSSEDSSNFVETYINNWIQNQLMLHFAEEYLKSQKDEIEKKTENFKNSLLIHQFKLQLVKINSDSLLNSDEIESYYNAHYQEFKLNTSIIRGFFVKIPVNSSGIDNFKALLHNSYERDLDEIISFVNSVDGNFDDFTKEWVDFPSKIMKIPIAIENPDEFIKNHKTIEITDNGFYYFILINDYMEKGATSPIEYARESIVKIIQQKQSNTILNKFQKEKYNEALKDGSIEFYQ